MFQGFSDETFEFFMAIRFNNNREFFHENHDLYRRALRDPGIALAEALGPVMLELDPQIDTRPNRAVARINRDIRFSNDKSPYRDYTWIAFRRPGADGSAALGAYLDLGVEGMGMGAGFYGENRPLMNALRRRILEDPDAFLRALPDGREFEPHITTYKRMAIPEGLPEALAPWYRAKGFYVEKTIADFGLIKSPALLDALVAGYRALIPLYRYVSSLTIQVGDE